MFCTKCGTKLDDTARFCVLCGKPTQVPPDQFTSDVPPQYAAPEGGAPPLPGSGDAFATEGKRLRRILAGKKIAGVCNGYAEYFSMDVTLMRLIWIGLLLVPPHIGLIGYIVSWIVLPKS